MRSRLVCCLALVTLGGVLFPGVAGADLPPEAYRFYAIYDDFFPGGGRNRRVAQFTPEGPIEGTFLPASLSEHELRVAADPRGPEFYVFTRGMMSSRLNPETGEQTPLPYTDGELDDHPTGLTFDTTRNRLVLSTIGGEGFLHSYDPASGAWSRLANLDNEDVYSVTYSAFDDAYYGLLPGSVLVRYDADGRPAGTRALSPAVPAMNHFDLFEVQLVAAGDRLVLLTPPGDPGEANALAVPAQHSYLINPRTGAVQALGPVHVVPEPGVGVVVACAGRVLLRRRGRR